MTFFILAGALALGVVAVVYRASISHFLCPRDALPSHLKEVCTSRPNHLNKGVSTHSFSLVSTVTHFYLCFGPLSLKKIVIKIFRDELKIFQEKM